MAKHTKQSRASRVQLVATGSSAGAEMPVLTIKLLGGFEVRTHAGELLTFSTRKAEALLSILALRAGQVQPRDKLCGLLWPEVADARARHSLRQTVFSLRNTLPQTAAPLLISTARALALDAARIHVDVAAVEHNLELGSRESLSRAAAAYSGDLLDGLTVAESVFEQWHTFERERLRAVMARGLTRLVELQASAGDLGEAIQSCAQLLQLDPLREESHRSLMRLLLRQGRRSSAVQQYHALCRMLRDELGAEPEPETQELYAELERGVSMLVVREPAVAERVSSRPVVPVTGNAGATDVGRDAEHRALSAAFAAGPGSPRLVFIAGEAGVGKTHVCDRWAATVEASGARVMRARCFESEQVLPFALWVNAIRDSGALADPNRMRAMPAAFCAELATLLPEISLCAPAIGRAHDALRLFQALHWLLTDWSGPGPWLIVVEDLHWADEMSLKFLSFLSRHSAPTGLILGTARDEERPVNAELGVILRELEREQQLLRLALAPLPRLETVALAQQLAASHGLGELSARWIDEISAISEGNALVVVESVRSLVGGSIDRGVSRLPVPARVRSLIVARLSRFSPVARDVIAFASVFGRDCEAGLLESAAPDSASAAHALDELLDGRVFVIADNRVSFAHDRIRETVYESLNAPRRRVLHASAASALERRYAARLDDVCGLVGYHYSHAGNAPASTSHLIRFAHRAWRSHGLAEAVAALERALADAKSLPAEPRAAQISEVLLLMAPCLSFLGRFGEVVEHLAAHEADVEALAQPAVAGQFQFWLGFARNALGERTRAETHARRSLDLASRAGDERWVGYAHALLAFLCGVSGRFAEGAQHGALATNLIVDDDDMFTEASTFAWINLAYNQIASGQWRDALASCAAADARARALDSTRGMSLAAASSAYVHMTTEHWEDALASAQRAVELTKEPFVLGLSLVVMGGAFLGSGRAREAVDLLRLVVEQFEQRGMRGWSGLAMALLAEAELAVSSFGQAAQLAAEALEIVRMAEDRLSVGFALRVLGRSELAVGRVDIARRHLREALREFEAIGASIQIGQTLVSLAEVEAVAADREGAGAELRRARSLFAERGLERGLARVDSLLAAL